MTEHTSTPEAPARHGSGLNNHSVAPSGVLFELGAIVVRPLALFFRVVSLVLITAGIVRITGVFGPDPGWASFTFYTVQSNLLCLVYLIVLVPASFVQDSGYVPFSLTDNLIHIITPCLLIVDWLLFVPKGRLRAFDPFLWAIIPLLYLVFAFVYGGLGGEFSPGQRYPYPFLDVDAHGALGVAARVLVLAIALIGVGYLYFGVDRLLSRRSRTAASANV